MARMPDIEAEAKAALGWPEHAVSGMFHHHHHAEAAPQTPAPAPVNLAAATAAAATNGGTMSLIADVENGYAAVKNELAKLEQNLPGALAVAKKLEGNPLVQVAIQAGDHFAAGILPPEALAVLASNAGKLLNDLLGLYNPTPQASGAPVQAQQPAPAQ